jgi:hypothetical protein
MPHNRWFEARDPDEWDEFVTSHGGSIFHTWDWRNFLAANGALPFYLVYRDGRDGRDGIRGVCPFVIGEGRRFRHLDTPPDSFMAGPIVDGDEAETLEALGSLPESISFSVRGPVVAMHIMCHQERIIRPMTSLGFPHKRKDYGLLMADLRQTPPERIWNDSFEKHDRQAVKYYERRGTEFRFAARETDLADYLALDRGPTWSRYDSPEAFSKLISNLGDNAKVALTTLGDKVDAGILLLCDRSSSTVHLITMKFTRARNIHSAVTYIDWKATQWAAEEGYRYIDFGPWLAAHVVDPAHFASRLKRRFGAAFVPRYKFTVRPSGLVYSVARALNRIALKSRG